MELAGEKNPMTIGPRVWKTGLAVALTFWLTQFFEVEYSFLAVIAAIISVQPTISDSLKKGWERILATAVGVVIALSMLIIFDASSLSMGVSVIIGILVCKYFKWYESIVLTSITIVILMSGYHEDQLLNYALYRTGLPFLGIGIAIVINLLFSPPRHVHSLNDSLKHLNEDIENLYMRVINGFITCKDYNPGQVEKLVEKVENQYNSTREILIRYKSELGYKKYFGGSEAKEIEKYEKALDLIWLVAQRIMDIHALTCERIERIGKMESYSTEYGDLLISVQELLYLTNSFQRNILINFLEPQENFKEIISSQYQEIKESREKLRKSINRWQESHLGPDHIKSLIEIATLVYDLDQICKHLIRLMEITENQNITVSQDTAN